MDYGMATKKGAQALETGRRRQRLNTMQKLAKKRKEKVKQAKKSNLLKPDSSGDARVRAAEKEYDSVLRDLRDAKKLSTRVPFKDKTFSNRAEDFDDRVTDFFKKELKRKIKIF